MKRVLLTGFEPFGGARTNPSQQIVRELDREVIAGHEIVGRVLPCVFGRSRRELARHVRTVKPALVICLGLAERRSHITPERVAINLDDAPIPDNEGRQPRDRAVVRGGPAAYFSTLPIRTIVARLTSIRIPVELSNSAGTFVCNHVFYGLMHLLKDQANTRGGFIHVPLAAGSQSEGMELATMLRGIRLAIEVSLIPPPVAGS